MANEIGSAYVSIVPSLRGAGAKISSELGGLDLSGAGAKMGKSITGGLKGSTVAIGNIISSAVGKACSVISSSLDGAIARVDTLNQFPKMMANLGFGTDQAARAVNRLSDGITGLPTTLDEIVGNAQALTLSFNDLDKGVDVALALNDGLLTYGASAATVTNAVTQLNQMITAGKYDMQSWNSINQSAPGFLDAVAKAMLGETARAADLREALNSGKVSGEEFTDMLVTLDKEGAGGIKAFSQTAADATGGIATSMKNVRSAVVKNLGNVIDVVNGSEGLISGAFDKMKAGVNKAGGAIVEGVKRVKTAAYGLRDGTLTARAAVDGLVAGTALEPWLERIESKLKGMKEELDAGVSPLAVLRGEIAAVTGRLASLPGHLEGIRASIVASPLAPLIDSMAEFRDKAQQFLWSPLGKLVSFSGLFAGALAVLSGPIHAAAGLFSKMGAAATAAAGALGRVAGTVAGAVARVAPLVTGPLSMLVRALPAVAGALGGLLSPVTLVVGAVAALAAGFAYLMATDEGFRAEIGALVSQIGASLAPCLAILAQGLRDLAAGVLPPLMNIVYTIIPVIGQVVSVVLQLLAAIAPVVTQILAVVVPVATTVIGLMAEVVAGIVGVLMPVISAILDIVSAVLPVVQFVFTTAMNAIMAVVNVVWPVIQGVITTALAVIEGIIGAVMCVIEGDWEGAWNIISSALSTAWDAITGAVEAGISGVVGFFSDLPGNILGALGDLGSLLWNAGSSIVDGLLNGIKGAIGGVYDFVSGIGSKIASLKGPIPYDLKLLIPNGRAIMDGLETGLKKGSKGVYAYVGGVADELARAASPNVQMSCAAKVSASERQVKAVGSGGGTVVNNYTMGDVTVEARDMNEVRDMDDFFNRLKRAKDTK